jgi:S-DNA-T family DNA segregation ATPase FtsK/SpoIIIE
MRISLTALTGHGPRDVVINGDSTMTVASVARSLFATLSSDFRPTEIGSDQADHPFRAQAVTGDARAGLWMDGRMLDPAAPAARELRDGAIVTVDQRLAAATVLAEPTGLVEIRVAGGPVAGTVHRLGIGTAVLGSAADTDVPLADPRIPPRALQVTVEGGRTIVAPAAPTPGGAGPAAGTATGTVSTGTVSTGYASPSTGTTLAGVPLTGAMEWPPGAMVIVGSTVLTLAPSEPRGVHLAPLDEGGLAYNRPPRLTPFHRPRRVEVPRPPERNPRERLRLFGALLFSAFGLAMAFALRQWYWALFALSWPVMQIGEWIGDRMHGRKSYKRAVKDYKARRAEFGRTVERLRREDEAERRALDPDPAEVLLTATGPRRRLWERRRTDPDALRLRIGLADRPADIELAGADAAPPDAPLSDAPLSDAAPAGRPISRTVPVALPLTELGVIGLTGPRDRSRRLARWLVAQAAALHSPRDLSIVVLCADARPAAAGGPGQTTGPGDGAAPRWNWVRWLPHAAPRDDAGCLALVGADPDSIAHRVTELTNLIAERRRAGAAAGFFAAPAGPDDPAAGHAHHPYSVLVVLDGARVLRRVPGMPQVLAQGPAHGVYAICVDDEERLLPEECAAVVAWDWDRPDHVVPRGPGLDGVGAVLADQVSPAWCERLARALAPVRDVSRDDAAEAIPASARLLDLTGTPRPTAEHVLASWSHGGRTTRVPIGVGADGVFSLDLRADGPHGLVAGTTGAGKSELLQTLIAALALTNRPDEMTFVLIDYKGGAAFKGCAALPHTVGLVTDLDGHLTERALESLAAELRRREEVLLRAGAKDIDDYHELRDDQARRDAHSVPAAHVPVPHAPGLRLDHAMAAAEPPPPLPRLVLVIDEFATLVAELPDFVAGLVDIGRRGRSLGVHLILATQRPAGVVTADIRANTNLRVALRVTDAEESIDVLDTADAARISKSTPGRCYVRSGVAPPQLVQSARIGGRRPGGGATAETEVAVLPLPWDRLGRPLPARAAPAAQPGAESAAPTDLAMLVDAVRDAATRARVPLQPSPWLDPLPDEYVLETPTAPGGSAVELAPAPIGVTDLPAEQSRAPLALDLAAGGHVYLAGASRSGRSTALRTLAGALASLYTPYDVHLYAIDCGAGALLPLVALPHCGAVVGREQLDRVERLLAALATEVARRQQLLAEAGFASLTEQRAAVAVTERLPWMVLLLDQWEGFVAAFENYDYGRLVDAVLRLLREGGAVGLRAVFAGDRSGLQGQVSTVFDRRLVMRMANPSDYGFAGFNERMVPSVMPPGRVLEQTEPGGPLRESQIGLLDADPAGPAQVAALQRIARGCASRYGRLARARRPLHVDELPVRVTYAAALGLDAEFTAPSALWALAGAGGDELAPVGADLLADGPGFVVAGPPRSGRSTALLTMVESLLDPAVGAGLVPVVLVTPRRSPLAALAGRPGVLTVLDGAAEAAELDAAIGTEHRYVVVVDDAELLDETELDEALSDVLRTARDGQHAVVIGGTTEDLGRGYRGFLSDARRSRSGLLLGVRSADDGELLGLRLPRNASAGGPIGRGLFVATGVATPIQVAVPPAR